MVGEPLLVREKGDFVKAVLVNAVVIQIGWLGRALAGANHLRWLGTTGCQARV
jgi:hypothetical protein